MYIFGSKIRTFGIPLQTPVFLYVKVGLKGVYILRTCFPDEVSNTPPGQQLGLPSKMVMSNKCRYTL